MAVNAFVLGWRNIYSEFQCYSVVLYSAEEALTNNSTSPAGIQGLCRRTIALDSKFFFSF